jgi:hypothetical protein
VVGAGATRAAATPSARVGGVAPASRAAATIAKADAYGIGGLKDNDGMRWLR